MKTEDYQLTRDRILAASAHLCELCGDGRAVLALRRNPDRQLSIENGYGTCHACLLVKPARSERQHTSRKRNR